MGSVVQTKKNLIKIMSNQDIKLSAESAILLAGRETILKEASTNLVPCYMASVLVGLSPTEYVNGLLGLSESDPIQKQTRTALRSCDFNTYMKVLRLPEDQDPSNLIKLFEPIFAYPQDSDQKVRTLKIVFSDPTGKNEPSFIGAANERS